MFKLLQRWLLPYHCVVCHHFSDQARDLCFDCQASLPYLAHCCECCAIPLPAGKYCGQCLQKPPYFNHTTALFGYQPPINQWITQLKFHRNLQYTRLLSELFIEKHFERPQATKDQKRPKNGKSHPPDCSLSGEKQRKKPELIIPVPLHIKRLRHRGFNQALELARPIAKLLDIPIEKHCCQRTRHTQAQSSIPAKQRRHNLKNAFQFNGKAPHHVAIIDDVMTTGHTVNELSHALRLAGSEYIEIWTIARTIPHA